MHQKKKSNSIGLDLDGVCFDFITHFTEYINKQLGTSYKPEQITTWAWEESIDIDRHVFWNLLDKFHETGEWQHTPFYEGAVEAIRKLIANDYEITIISARPHDSVKIGFNKILDHFDDIESLGLTGYVACRESKLPAALDAGVEIFIEDKPEHVEEIAAHGNIVVYFVRGNHNKSYVLKGKKNIVEVNSLKEAVDHILKG